jgi:hypothetical protein
MLVSCLTYSSTLKMEAMFSSETGWFSMDYMVPYPRSYKISNFSRMHNFNNSRTPRLGRGGDYHFCTKILEFMQKQYDIYVVAGIVTVFSVNRVYNIYCRLCGCCTAHMDAGTHESTERIITMSWGQFPVFQLCASLALAATRLRSEAVCDLLKFLVSVVRHWMLPFED